jgi:cell wall-associated NlpC family hydrolase
VSPTRLLRRGRPAILAAILALVGSAALTAPLPARADRLSDARTRAAALNQQVQSLQVRAEAATERYDALEAQLGQAVTERMLALRELDALRARTAVDRDQVGGRARALYMSGGAATLFATVLDSPDFTDAMARYHDVGVLLSVGHATADSAQKAADRAAVISHRLDKQAAKVTALQSSAARAAENVRSLLTRQQQALSSADAQVRSLVRQAALAQAARSAQDFAQALVDAGGSLSAATAPNALVARVIAAARTKLGDPYQWGGTGPDAYDCSGLTQFAYGQAGIALPRVASAQYFVGAHVGIGDLQPGDLLFWATDPSNPASIHHVAIYLGGGAMLAAPHTGDVVKIQPVYLDGFIGATRPYLDA